MNGRCNRFYRIEHECSVRYAGRDLLEQLQPFACHRGFEIDETGEVTSGLRQACDEAGAYRVDDDHEYDRDCPGLPLKFGYLLGQPQFAVTLH
jgi:hypothetical protein